MQSYTTMSEKPSVSFRLTQQLYDRVVEYRENRNMSESDAFRELTRKGLEYDQLERRLERMDTRIDELEDERDRGFFSRLLR